MIDSKYYRVLPPSGDAARPQPERQGLAEEAKAEGGVIGGVALLFHFGLVGGGMYLYFVGRGIASRLTMQHRGIHIGRSNLKVNLFLTLWGIIAVVTIIMAVTTLTL